MQLSHIDETGNAKMVDVSDKVITVREAVATGKIYMKPETISCISNATLPKGDAISTARIAGITAAKNTSGLIPLCHQVPLDSIKIEFTISEDSINIMSTVRCTWKTGVEMEALIATSVAALTLYDMCKAIDKDMVIGEIMLVKKTGGKSNYARISL
jgi:cyclic pyranopterin phosphate synthase